jgi:hypothetical protein
MSILQEEFSELAIPMLASVRFLTDRSEIFCPQQIINHGFLFLFFIPVLMQGTQIFAMIGIPTGFALHHEQQMANHECLHLILFGQKRTKLLDICYLLLNISKRFI